MASLQDTRTCKWLAHSHRVHRPLAVQAGAGASWHHRAPVYGDHKRRRGGLVALRLLRPWLAHTISHFALPPEAGRRAITRADSARLDCLASESRDDSRSCSAALDFGRRGIEQFVSEMTRTPNKTLERTAALLCRDYGLGDSEVADFGERRGRAAVAQLDRCHPRDPRRAPA